MSLLSAASLAAAPPERAAEEKSPFELEINVTPTKRCFAANEPISVQITLSNVSATPLQLYFRYPDHIGLSFTCRSKDAAAQPLLVSGRFPVMATGSGPLPALTLAPGATCERVFCLDRYIVLTKPGRYNVEYQAQYHETGLKRDEPHERAGMFEVGVLESSAGEDYWRRIQRQLTRKEKKKIREALEQLLFWRDPRAIDEMLRLATNYPDYGTDIALALEKFAENRKGEDALLELTRIGEYATVATALLVLQNSIGVPVEAYRELSVSPDAEKRCAILEHLLELGEKKHVDLVEQMRKDDDPVVAELAHAFLRRVRSERPGE